jgi:hypothetical protein
MDAPAMTTEETQQRLYQVLKAHKFDLETTRGVTSGPDLEVLDRRIEAARRLLEWLAQALELEPAASLTVQTPPPSTSPVDQDQTPPSAPDSPKTSRR